MFNGLKRVLVKFLEESSLEVNIRVINVFGRKGFFFIFEEIL